MLPEYAIYAVVEARKWSLTLPARVSGRIDARLVFMLNTVQSKSRALAEEWITHTTKKDPMAPDRGPGAAIQWEGGSSVRWACT